MLLGLRGHNSPASVFFDHESTTSEPSGGNDVAAKCLRRLADLIAEDLLPSSVFKMKRVSSSANVLEVARPQRDRIFDPWNSSSTGHQRPETRVGTGWRDSRNLKINMQFYTDLAGIADAVNSHAANKSSLSKRPGPVVQLPGQITIVDMLQRPMSTNFEPTPVDSSGQVAEADIERSATEGASFSTLGNSAAWKKEFRRDRSGIFKGCVVYVNGSTHPDISDHKLKNLLVEHGACMSIHLARRKVTHVVLGRPKNADRGAGGGLASGKIHMEIRKIRGCSVKYVEVEW